MVLKAPVELEMRKSKDGLGFNIKGGRDRKFIEEDNGIFVSTIRENGAAAEVRF